MAPVSSSESILLGGCRARARNWGSTFRPSASIRKTCWITSCECRVPNRRECGQPARSERRSREGTMRRRWQPGTLGGTHRSAARTLQLPWFSTLWRSANDGATDCGADVANFVLAARSAAVAARSGMRIPISPQTRSPTSLADNLQVANWLDSWRRVDNPVNFPGEDWIAATKSLTVQVKYRCAPCRVGYLWKGSTVK